MKKWAFVCLFLCMTAQSAFANQAMSIANIRLGGSYDSRVAKSLSGQNYKPVEVRDYSFTLKDKKGNFAEINNPTKLRVFHKGEKFVDPDVYSIGRQDVLKVISSHDDSAILSIRRMIGFEEPVDLDSLRKSLRDSLGAITHEFRRGHEHRFVFINIDDQRSIGKIKENGIFVDDVGKKVNASQCYHFIISNYYISGKISYKRFKNNRVRPAFNCHQIAGAYVKFFPGVENGVKEVRLFALDLAALYQAHKAVDDLLANKLLNSNNGPKLKKSPNL